MASNDSSADMLDALSAPLGDIISAVGRGVADAQEALDAQTIESFKALYNLGDEQYQALRQIGYQPTWYQIPEATAEISIALTLSGSGNQKLQDGEIENRTKGPHMSRVKLYGAPVDAGYSSRYNYNLQAASTLRFRIVPVPPSTLASEMKVVPDLVDKTIADASLILDELDITYDIVAGNEFVEAETTEVIVETHPAVNELILANDVLLIYI